MPIGIIEIRSLAPKSFGRRLPVVMLAPCEINHDAAQLKRGRTANGLDRWEPEPSPIYCATELLWGVSPMTTKTIDSGQERSFDSIAREQFDAFEDQERLIREEERAARAAQLNLPMQISTRLRAHKKRLLKKGRR
jgi:hypothetical protein